MDNTKAGKVGAGIAGVAVAVFALAMLVGLICRIHTSMVSFFASIFIAIGYIILVTAFAVPRKDKPLAAAGLASLAFSVVYAILIFIVYFAMLTTVRMNNLSKEILSIISYEHLGSLFFNYNLLGYGFMGLSTFFAGFIIIPKTKGDKTLRLLLHIHGVFFVFGLLLPMVPLFTPDMQNGGAIGTFVLLVWCAYFLPVCILSWRYFQSMRAAK